MAEDWLEINACRVARLAHCGGPAIAAPRTTPAPHKATETAVISLIFILVFSLGTLGV